MSAAGPMDPRRRWDLYMRGRRYLTPAQEHRYAKKLMRFSRKAGEAS